MRAKEGDDIPNHLTRLKNQCNLIKDFGNVEDSERYNDNVFKRDIASSLPRSWDAFTGPYVKGYADDNLTHADAMKLTNSQQFIGLINQEYDLQQTRKEEENGVPLKGEKQIPSQDNQANKDQNGEEKNLCTKHQCKQCG